MSEVCSCINIKNWKITLSFPVNCDSDHHQSKIGINVALIQSACWDVSDAIAEIRQVNFQYILVNIIKFYETFNLRK